jgi:MFS family permease
VSPGAAIASVSTLGYSGFLLGPPVLGLVAEYTSMASVFIILMLLTAIIFAASKQLAPSNSK